MKRFLSLLLALLMLLASVSALAESETEESGVTLETGDTQETGDAQETEAAPKLLVTINGKEIYDNNEELQYYLSYYNYVANYYGYDTADPDMQKEIQGIAMQYTLSMLILREKAVEMGLDEITEEQMAEFTAEATENWAEVVNDYEESYLGITETSTEEERTAARGDALAQLEGMGYTEERYIAESVDNEVTTELISRVQNELTKGLNVTDEDVLAHFNELVEEDRAQYEGNVSQYEFMTSYYGQDSYYIPDGYRGIVHILLKVDEELLNAWKDLTARLEEQAQAEEATDESADEADEEDAEEVEDEAEETAEEVAETAEEAADETEEEDAGAAEEAEAETEADAEVTADTETEAAEATPTEEPTEPVTAEMVEAAKQAILDSVKDTVDEIMAKYEAGTSFAELIAEYGTDPGMLSEDAQAEYSNGVPLPELFDKYGAEMLGDNAKNGYPIHPESFVYDAEFVKNSMLLENVGDVSAPFVSQFGVHILQYLRDIPGGAIELTDTMKEEIRDALQNDLETDAINGAIDQWMAEADIVYTEAGEAWHLDESATVMDDDDEGEYEIEMEMLDDDEALEPEADGDGEAEETEETDEAEDEAPAETEGTEETEQPAE